MLKRKDVILILLLAVTGFIFAEEIGTAQINTDILNTATVETYINDKSPVSWKNFNSGKQIRDMGRRLGAEVKYQAEINKAQYPFSSGSPDYKYKATRVYSVDDKAGADVIYIGRLAKINNITNLRRVISGYIERAYDISMEQADEITVKVCYWNTNHYDDKAYFKKNFAPRVLEVFSNRTKIIGLARSYKNWPGKTRLVIPFVLIKEVVPEAIEPEAPQAVTEESATIVEPQEPEPVQEAPVDITPQKMSKNFSPIIIVLIIAIIILIIAMIVLVLSKKRRNKN